MGSCGIWNPWKLWVCAEEKAGRWVWLPFVARKTCFVIVSFPRSEFSSHLNLSERFWPPRTAWGRFDGLGGSGRTKLDGRWVMERFPVWRRKYRTWGVESMETLCFHGRAEPQEKIMRNITLTVRRNWRRWLSDILDIVTPSSLTARLRNDIVTLCFRSAVVKQIFVQWVFQLWSNLLAFSRLQCCIR